MLKSIELMPFYSVDRQLKIVYILLYRYAIPAIGRTNGSVGRQSHILYDWNHYIMFCYVSQVCYQFQEINYIQDNNAIHHGYYVNFQRTLLLSPN